MDFLKRNWFRFASGALLAGTVALYVFGVWNVQGEAESLRKELSDQLEKPNRWIRRPGDIPAKGEIARYTDFAKAVSEELARSQGMLKHPSRWCGNWPQRPLADYLLGMAPTRFQGDYNQQVIGWLLAEDDARPSGLANLRFRADKRSFDLQLEEYEKHPPTLQQMPRDAKRLMIQLELARILDACGAVSLPETGICFHDDSTASAAKDFPTLPGRASLKDPSRRTYPFTLMVDLEIQNLPKLLDGLTSSTFNLSVSALQIAKVRKENIEEWENSGLIKSSARNEVVRASLVSEAVEFLFGDPPAGEGPPS